MRTLALALVVFFCAVTLSFAQQRVLLIDDLEGPINGGPDGTVDFGSGAGSTVEVYGDTAIKHHGEQSLKIDYVAGAGGYMWIARGFGLDAANAGWIVAAPSDIDWSKYNAVSFYIYGSNSQATIAFDVKDSGGEMWRTTFKDDFTGWKQIVCPFDKFVARDDWQPDSADKNGTLNFPIMSYQLEPLPQGEGTIYLDQVELILIKE